MSINKLFKNRYFLPLLQFLSLIVFVLLIYSAIGITTQDPDFAKILRNTNLPNLIVWSYWWPLIIVMAMPDWANHSLNISGSPAGTVKAFIFFILLPFVFYIIFAIIKKAIAKESWKRSLTQLVIAILPVTASMHLLKAVFKTTSRIPYWDFAMSDPKGVLSAQLLTDNPDLLNKSFTSTMFPYISMIALLLSIGGLLLSLFVIRKQKDKNQLSKLITTIPVIIYAGIFMVTLFVWRIL